MKKAEIKSTKSNHSIWYKILSAIFIIANIGVCGGLIVSGYAGSINPTTHPTAPALAMTFPIWLLAALICLIITALVRWKIAIFGFLGILIALPPILEYSPSHIPRRVAEDADTFTFMSYNVFGLKSQDGEYPGDVNPTIGYILNQDPDIVCLQELGSLHSDKNLHLTPAQLDSLHSLYPYVFVGGHAQAIFSKFPIQPIQTGFKYSGEAGSADMACFRTEIKGQTITIFNVHLQSFDLLSSDREMFSKLKRLQGSEDEIARMKNHLVNKIREAGPQRVNDTEELIRYIKKFGGPNVIVCGDFNDIPGSYPLRMLSDEHLKEVYPEVGFGPMVTYNAGGFYFRIDHILYRGNLRPVKMNRGSIRSSDHYPITATFEIINR
ncbi:MAG: endonuclease/exonuclease/phosphatase family protein [Muribaculaceae bacterium]|nr:endonuclease/exonuclease/phosphatase family protein [Muribaculaceae bacterium]